MEYCDICGYCVHAYDDSDESVGLYGIGCDADAEEPTRGNPCPFFAPRLSSDSLMEQLEMEYRADQYNRDMEELRLEEMRMEMEIMERDMMEAWRE